MEKNLKNSSENLQLNDLLVEAILSNISALTRDKGHDAKTLIGPGLWTTFDNGMRRYIGGIVFKLVERNVLPLTYAGKTSSNKHIYWLR